MLTTVPMADPGREVAALGGAVEAAIDRVLRSGRFVLGPEVEAFEAEFASLSGRTWAVGVGNGTDALELALRAVGCGPGDEVVTVANAGGYAATAAAATGCTPVYVDVDPASLLADVVDLESQLGPRTGAVVLTHLYGRIHPQVEEIAALCRRVGVPLVEDCAQATGARLSERPAGSFGTLAAHSFYPTKTLGAVGDGGAVTADDADLAAAVRSLRQYGWREQQDGRMHGGRNSRLDELQAAVLRVKMPLLADRVARRRAVVESYRQAAPALTWVGVDGPSDARQACVVIAPDRTAFRRLADEAGVGTGVHYPVPDHLQPSLPSGVRALPVTEAACRQVVSLPCHPFLTPAEVGRVQAFLERAA
ncbi:MAG: aminotransferase class V-fold PLP-dependent enzyme [Acidimicrobiales bacterium]